MANEIRVSSTLIVKNGNFSGDWTASFNADQSALGGGNPGTVDLTTSETTIDPGDIDTEGWCWIKNIGAAQAATIGFATSYTTGLLILPGQTAGPFKLIAGTVLYAKALTSTTSIQVIILEA